MPALSLRITGALLIAGALIVAFGSHVLVLANLKRSTDIVIAQVDTPGPAELDLEPGNYLWTVPPTVVPGHEVAGNKPDRPRLTITVQSDPNSPEPSAEAREIPLRESVRVDGVDHTVVGELRVLKAGTVRVGISGEPRLFPAVFRADPISAAIRSASTQVISLAIAGFFLLSGVICLIVHHDRRSRALISEMDALD